MTHGIAMKRKPKEYAVCAGVLLLGYIAMYFVILDPSIRVFENGERIDWSSSRFARWVRPGNEPGGMTVEVKEKHWTNYVWRPVDVVVRSGRDLLGIRSAH